MKTTDLTLLPIACMSRELNRVQAQVAQLQAQCAHKDKILSVLSHDLRGPVYSISQFLTLCNTDELSEELKEIFVALSSQMVSVDELINNLLKWASSSINNYSEQVPEQIDLNSAVQKSMGLFNIIAHKKNIRLVDNLNEHIRVNVNPDHLDVIFRNIISNAVKFTPANGIITVTSRVEKKSAEIIVTDSGVGMNGDQLNKLFTPAYASTYGTLGERGSGLGLLLCKEYLEANNGTIFISSKVNSGTTITINLPLAS